MLSLFLTYPDWIDPYVINGLPIRWYALMYLVAFFVAYLLVRYQCRHDGVINMDAEETGISISAEDFSSDTLHISDTDMERLEKQAELFLKFIGV